MQINIFITVVTIVFILLILLIIYGSSVPVGNIIDRITNKLELLSGFFIGCGVILTVFIFNISDIEARKNITINFIDKSWISINHKLNNNYSKCPNFINSLGFSWSKNNNSSNKTINNDENNENNDNWYAINDISSNIFQSWEDFLTLSEFNESDKIGWINKFLAWAVSPQLKNIWLNHKQNYNIITQQFGDLLFDSLSDHIPQDTQGVIKVGTYIINSEKYNNILSNIK
jgi:hypothetical protein